MLLLFEQARSVVIEKGYAHKPDRIYPRRQNNFSNTDDAGVDPSLPSPRPTNVMQIVQIGIEEGGN